MSDMAESATGLPFSYSRDWSEQPRYVINVHSPLRAIQDGGRGNFEEGERLFFENRFKKISSQGKVFFNIGSIN